MKLKIALLLGIMLFAAPHLDGSIFCLTMVSREPEVGTYQEHPPAHTNCYCPCTAPRSSDGSCKVCGHKVCPLILNTSTTKIVVASAAQKSQTTKDRRGNKRHRLTN